MSAINSISLRTMLLVFFGLSGISFAQAGTITYEPDDGAGQGKHIVFVCGEWGYRCEEGLPMPAKILSKRHGFKCTVLFSVNPKDGGYATSLFGESWKGHYGHHGKESTRGLRAGMNKKHPILRGVHDVWGPTDVYRITKLPADAEVSMYGQVLTGMNPDDTPNLQKSIMPMVWTRQSKRDSDQVSRVVMSTIGAAQDMEGEELRRLYVNSIFWAVGLESITPEKADVSYVGKEWKASPYGGGKFKKGLNPEDFAVKAEKVQAGFFTPARAGKIWDTWIYYHDGKYYMYYLAGAGGHWDGHELATSEDGVHWKEQGVMIKPRAGVTWMGTGHIWKSPDFAKTHQWVMNYSEWFGDKQDIMFATSTDLLNWTKADEKYRFVQDVRWYKAKGRWDCIDAIQRDDGSLYGYFTANPAGGKVAYRPCGFGFAESKDGLTWKALPPVEGDIAGEFGGIQKLGDKYYILISEGRVAVGDKPEGPFHAQKKNPNAFGKGCNIYFPRFFHNAPGGPLVNHFYTGGTVFAAPLKAIEVDRECILRLKWWKNNDKLKSEPVETELVAAGAAYASSLRMLDKKLDLSRTHVIEGTVGELSLRAPGGGKYGIFFDHGDGQGQCLLLARDAVQFGEIKADGSNLKIQQTSSRDMEFGPTVTFRLVIKLDMMELYINDYLMNLKRVKCNGQVGFMGADDEGAFRNIKVWQSNYFFHADGVHVIERNFKST